MPKEGSKKFSLNKEDLRRVAVGAGVAASGAVLTYLSDAIPSVDWGVWTPIIVAGFSILSNLVRKWMTGTR